jgi:hypothetical protein
MKLVSVRKIVIKEILKKGKGSVDHHGRKTLASLARPCEEAISRLTK